MIHVAEIIIIAALLVGLYAAVVPNHLFSIRLSVHTVVLLLVAMCAMAGCMTKAIIPDHRDLPNGGAEYYGELPEHLTTADDCLLVRIEQRDLCTPAEAEKLATFDADKLAWNDAHTVEVPMWGCSAFDNATTIIGLAAGFAEANPLGLITIPIELIYNHIAEKRAAHGDLLMAKTSATVHCAAGGLNVLTLAGAL